MLGPIYSSISLCRALRSVDNDFTYSAVMLTLNNTYCSWNILARECPMYSLVHWNGLMII